MFRGDTNRGCDNFCRLLTTYQRKVILDYEKEEGHYKKVSVLMEENEKIETLSNNKDGLRKYYSIKRDLYDQTNVPIVGVERNGSSFSYVNIKKENGGDKVDLSQTLLINGEQPKEAINDRVGLLVFDTDDSPLPNKSSNALGLKIFNLPNCDKLSINTVRSKSSGH